VSRIPAGVGAAGEELDEGGQEGRVTIGVRNVGLCRWEADFPVGRKTYSIMYGIEECAELYQLMLQTAPVLLVFQPTVGPNAKPDGAPNRFDFVTG